MKKVSKSDPPGIARKLLRFFLKEKLQEEVIGDLQEQFENDLSHCSTAKAKLIYWYQIFNYLRPFAIRKFPTHHLISTHMFRHNFLISWRTILKNKGFSLINIGGLSLGMTVTILIALWVHDEVTNDRFHKNYENIYQIIAHRDFNGNIFTDRNMVFPLAEFISKEIPQVNKTVWTSHSTTHKITKDELSLKKDGLSVGGPFFNMFSWNFLQGNAETALSDPQSIVLTQSAAQVFFGNQDPVNEILKIDNGRDVRVSAIVEDPPANSSLKFDYILPFDLSDPDIRRSLDNWNNYSWNVLIELDPEVNRADIDKAITGIMTRQTESDESTYFSFPMKKWHLYNEFKDGHNTGGTIRYVRLFSLVALIIMLIASINFMNLSTARSDTRAMEVAVRKTLGSQKIQLVQQFFLESILLSVFAFIISLVSVYFLLPGFNLLVDKNLVIDIGHPGLWLFALGIVLITGLMAGSYPALYLSSFQPIRILKGRFQQGNNKVILPRRVLVVFQFIASIALISSTFIIYRQIQFVKNRDMGYNPNNLIMIPNNPALSQNYRAIRDNLLQTNQVSSLTRTHSPITSIWWKSPAPQWPGRPPETDILFSGLAADLDFAKTMGIDIKEGKDFQGVPADSSSVLLNEAAVAAMGLKDPVGQKITYTNKEYTIIGITGNVIMASPFESVEPLMIYYREVPTGYINVRLRDDARPQLALQEIQSVFEKFDPGSPFDFQFVDEEYGKKFAAEELINKIINIFAAIAIFICGLGLSGLVSYIIQKRMKEIAIRKVMGARPKDLLMLVSKEFLILVLVAVLVAAPVTHLVVNNWLDNYEYHVSISWWIFALVGVSILVLTLTIVGLNTFRAATTNPIRWIRSE